METVFRTLWEEYGQRDRGLEEEQDPDRGKPSNRLDLSDFFQRYIGGTFENDFGVFLGRAGLKLEPQEHPTGQGGQPARLARRDAEDDAGRARITSVFDDGPGRRAGLSPDDEVVALDGQRVAFADVPKALQRFPPAVFRRGHGLPPRIPHQRVGRDR